MSKWLTNVVPLVVLAAIVVGGLLWYLDQGRSGQEANIRQLFEDRR